MLALDTPRVCTKIILFVGYTRSFQLFRCWVEWKCFDLGNVCMCIEWTVLKMCYFLSLVYTVSLIPVLYSLRRCHYFCTPRIRWWTFTLWPYRTGFRFHVSRIPHGFTAQHHYSRAGVVIPQRMLICRGRPGVIIDHSVWKGLQLFPGVGTVVVWKRALVVVPFSPTCTHHCLFSYSPHFTFSSVTSTHGQSTPSWLWHGRLHQRPEWHALPSHV